MVELDRHPDSFVRRIAVEFGVSVRWVSPVHGGQDSSATVWRGLLTDGSSVAIKAQAAPPRGLLVPSYLAECGVPGIVAPLLTRTGSPVATINRLHVSVQPWISGQMGAVARLCPEQWRSFGELLARIHATELPARLREEVATEGYVPVAVAPARRLQRHLLHGQVDTADDLVRSLTEEWRAASGRIAVLIDAVERLAIVLRQRSVRTVLFHGDAHIATC